MNNCRVLEHIARDCRSKGKGKEKGGDEGKGYVKNKGKTTKGTGMKGSGREGGPSGE